MMNDDDEFFLQNRWLMKGIEPYFQPGPVFEVIIIIITNH